MQRRQFLRHSAALAALAAVPAAARAQVGRGARVVVVGGGFAGAACARYLRLWAPGASVTLVEAAREFVSCPMSNRVIGGTMSIRDLTRRYDGLASRHGVRVINDTVTAIDPATRQITLAGGSALPYDRLVIAPGIAFDYAALPGLNSAAAQERVPHAWKAGPQTHELRRRIGAMPQGGVFAMHIPKAPLRCPPGPYERACLVASALRRSNPTAKVLVFDANPGILAKRELFADAFANRYKGMIEYVPNAGFEAIDAASGELSFDVHGKVRADVWNVIPPQRAGELALQAGLGGGQGWCEVDFLSYESRLVPAVHVIGDAIASAPGTPKSAHMANQQAKVCAAAIAAHFAGRAVNPEPIIANTCYSFVSDKEAIHIAGVYRYDDGQRTIVAVPGAGGLSARASGEEAFMAVAWSFNILNDTLGMI
ncbi:NAD(P)/FAD-dependent oxidoreductase [Pseudothauera lacus]|uniref:Flavocytochrome C n=1 Tax=Pseudothauera lacus TaxID=2136175 RepID=A0A2T4IJJ2_9RHOO|nr:NAD(P)/FAD-dependent oxidoreductase [Pseudothauera lacus]PTD97943.1 flavocytochrome C [Pseudothauera lacus]